MKEEMETKVAPVAAVPDAPAEEKKEQSAPARSIVERKPVRIAEIKGIREKAEDGDFEEEEDQVWFESAVQEE